jgi:hypothetical protein
MKNQELDSQLSGLQTMEQGMRFLKTCTPEEVTILQSFLTSLRDKVSDGQLPHVGVLLVAGCSDPAKPGRRKDIDLRITTETPTGTEERASAVESVRMVVPKLFGSMGIECSVGPKQTGVPRKVTAIQGGKEVQLTLIPTRGDMVTSAVESIRSIDIFVQSVDDPPLSQHHLAEEALGSQYLVLLDTRTP